MSKPTKYPRWASNDVVDPSSLQNNVVEPNSSKKDLGFGPEGEYPMRQHFNWLFRLINNWIVWFDEQMNGLFPVTSGSFSGRIKTDDVSVETTMNIHWRKHKNNVTLTFDGTAEGGGGASNRLRIYPLNGEVWPAEILPKNGRIIYQPFTHINNSQRRIGNIEIESLDNEPWDVHTSNDSGVLSDTNFNTGGIKGWVVQSIVYNILD